MCSMYKNGRKKTVFNEFLHAFADGFAPKLVQQSEISGQRSEIRDQRSEISGQWSVVRDQRSVVSGQLPASGSQRSGFGRVASNPRRENSGLLCSGGRPALDGNFIFFLAIRDLWSKLS
jgi:hypothetical protein